FRDLDATVGRDNYLAILTADHGFMPAPEVSQQRGLAAGRLSGSQLLGKVNAALEREFGAPKLAAFLSASGVVLDRKLIAQHQLPFDAVAESARKVVAGEQGVAAVYTRRELESGSRVGAPFFDAMRKSWNREL